MTAQSPFFSIIIPTYNRAKQLQTAINSVLGQEFKGYEVIIVDDGSTDNTKEIVKEIVKENQFIKYYYKINEERSIARNYGIQVATGKYINFLDSDDILYPNHFAVAYNLLSNSLPEVGHLGFETIDKDGRRISVTNNLGEDFKEKLIHENILHGNAIFVRRDIAVEVNFIPSRFAILSEDWYVWLRLAARYPFHFDNIVTSAVIHHDERSLLNINPDMLIINTDLIVGHLKEDIPFLNEYKKKVKYHFANHYTFLCLVLSLTKKRRLDTIRFLLKAMSYDPMVVFRKRFLASLKHFL